LEKLLERSMDVSAPTSIRDPPASVKANATLTLGSLSKPGDPRGKPILHI